MSLDARVYVHRDKLPIDVDDLRAYVEEETGEVFFDDPSAIPRELELVALDKRLGNVSMVHWLVKQIKDVLGSGSLLLGKVLYNGSHSGDWIGQADLGRLREEIASVWNLTEGHRSVDLDRFLEDLRELTKAAEEQGDPIVFV